MPKLTKIELNRRAQDLKNLYIKHKGNKSRIAEELKITPQAINDRFNSEIGEKAQDIIEDEVRAVAKKLGINLTWYIKKIKEGIVKPKCNKKPDYSIRHKYIVTLGEALKYIKQNGTTVDSSSHIHLTVEKKEGILANIREAVAKGLI